MLRLSVAAVVGTLALSPLSHALAQEDETPARTFSIDVVKPADDRTNAVTEPDFPTGAITETQAIALPMPEDDQSE